MFLRILGKTSSVKLPFWLHCCLMLPLLMNHHAISVIIFPISKTATSEMNLNLIISIVSFFFLMFSLVFGFNRRIALCCLWSYSRCHYFLTLWQKPQVCSSHNWWIAREGEPEWIWEMGMEVDPGPLMLFSWGHTQLISWCNPCMVKPYPWG